MTSAIYGVLLFKKLSLHFITNHRERTHQSVFTIGLRKTDISTVAHKVGIISSHEFVCFVISQYVTLQKCDSQLAMCGFADCRGAAIKFIEK